jgi:hypothetical protein
MVKNPIIRLCQIYVVSCTKHHSCVRGGDGVESTLSKSSARLRSEKPFIFDTESDTLTATQSCVAVALEAAFSRGGGGG